MAVDVIITRTNSIINSPRVQKIASSLKAHYKTRVVGWNREGLSGDKNNSFVTDLDLLQMKGPIGKMTIALYLPIFWIYLFAKLVRYQPKIVHACDLDTLPPSLIFRTVFRKKLIFDVCDRYAMSKISPNNRFLYSFVNWFEEFLGQRADYMINVSEKRASTFKRKPKNVAVIMNCADTGLNKLAKQNSEVKSICDGDNGLILVYTGNIVRKRGLEQISAALLNIPNVRLVMAGKVTDNGFMNQLLTQPGIKYCGQLPWPEALGLEAAADVLVTLYDTDIPNNRYANPNKIFEAMMFGVPIITNVLEEIIQSTKCGVIVEYKDIGQITRAIVTLRDDHELRRKLGENGKLAFEQQYNWSHMEKTLLRVYEQIQKPTTSTKHSTFN